MIANLPIGKSFYDHPIETISSSIGFPENNWMTIDENEITEQGFYYLFMFTVWVFLSVIMFLARFSFYQDCLRSNTFGIKS